MFSFLGKILGGESPEVQETDLVKHSKNATASDLDQIDAWETIPEAALPSEVSETELMEYTNREIESDLGDNDGWEAIPKVRFKTEDLTIIFHPTEPEAKEGIVADFEKIKIYSTEENDFVVTEIGVPKKENVNHSPELKIPHDIHLIFHHDLVSIHELLTQTTQHIDETNVTHPTHLRDVTIKTIISALQRLTGVYFNVYWATSQFDLRSPAIHIKDEQRHFAFLDSFLKLKPEALHLRRKALGNGYYQYIIEAINPRAFIDCIEQSQGANAFPIENTQLHYTLIKQYLSLHSSGHADTLIISAPSVTCSYPHLRTRFMDAKEAQALENIFLTLEAKIKEKQIQDAKEEIHRAEMHTKLCLKYYYDLHKEDPWFSENPKHTDLFQQIDFDETFQLYSAQLNKIKPCSEETIRQSIADDSGDLFSQYQELMNHHQDAAPERILKTLCRETFFNEFGVLHLDSKSQSFFTWQMSEDKLEKRVQIDKDNPFEQFIIKIGGSERFIQLMLAIEPRLQDLMAKQKSLSLAVPIVPVYDQGQLIHDLPPEEKTSFVYHLKNDKELEKDISRCIGHLLNARNKIAFVKNPSITAPNYVNIYQQKIHEQLALFDEYKISADEISKHKELIEATIDYVINIFDEVRMTQSLSSYQLELLAVAHVLFLHSLPNFKGNFFENFVAQFDLAKAQEVTYRIKWAEMLEPPKKTAVATSVPEHEKIKTKTGELRDSGDSKELPVTRINKTTATVVRNDANDISPEEQKFKDIIQELLSQLIEFRKNWATVPDAAIPNRLIFNLMDSLSANSNITALKLVKSIISFNMTYLQKSPDRFNCHQDLAEILRLTLVKIALSFPESNKVATPIVKSVQNVDPPKNLNLHSVTQTMSTPLTSASTSVIEAKLVNPSQNLLPKNEPVIHAVIAPLPIETASVTPTATLESKRVKVNEPSPKDIEFIKELEEQLRSIDSKDSVISFDQDQTLYCQHTGKNPFHYHVSDLLFKEKKYEEVLSHFPQLTTLLKSFSPTDVGITSFNENSARTSLIAEALGMDTKRAFAFPIQLLDCYIGYQVTQFEAAALINEYKSKDEKEQWGENRILDYQILSDITGLTKEHMLEIRDLLEKLIPVDPAKTISANERLGKMIHITFQLIASNLVRFQNKQNFAKNCLFIDDDSNNIKLAKQFLIPFFKALTTSEKLKNIPGIQTLQDINLITITPKLSERKKLLSGTNGLLFTKNAGKYARRQPKHQINKTPSLNYS